MELATLLHFKSDALEADLQRFYSLDLAKFWRGELSLRRLSVLVHYLPSDAATVREDAKLPPGWDVPAFLLADLFQAFTGKPHPARPQPTKAASTSRYSATRAALERQRERLAKQTP